MKKTFIEKAFPDWFLAMRHPDIAEDQDISDMLLWFMLFGVFVLCILSFVSLGGCASISTLCL